jgi:hypothetical protein
MTAIVAIVENNTVYMGGDSAGVNVSALSVTVRKDPKVFKNGPFIMGFTSSFRMGQLLRYSFKPPTHPNNMSIDRYMNTIFIDAVRNCLKDGGYAKVKENNESGGNFLVGYRGKLFNIDGDFQVGIPSCNYDSVGCGQDLCLGSLHTTEKVSNMKLLSLLPKERIKMALKAAVEFSAGVRGPFNILSLKYEE